MEARAREVVLMVEEEVKRVERRMPSPLLSKSQEPLRMWRDAMMLNMVIERGRP